MNTIRDFKVGNRVSLHPATDLWMRGARFGTVRRMTRTHVHVHVDVLGRSIAVRPNDITFEDDGEPVPQAHDCSECGDTFTPSDTDSLTFCKPCIAHLTR